MTPRRGHLRLVATSAAGRRGARGLNCTRTYGLTATEIRAEMRRLTSQGFQLWEIARVFGCDCTSKD